MAWQTIPPAGPCDCPTYQPIHKSGPCDDGDPCTTNDRCENGVCTGDRITISVQGPTFVCAGQTYAFSATVSPSGPSVTWSGDVDAAGNLTVPATAMDGDSFTATASVGGCSSSASVTASDGRPGDTSEAANCLLNPIDCLTVNGLADEALAWAQNNQAALGGGLFQGCADAARHAYWNALMAQELGRQTAQDFGDAHEFSNFNNCDDNNMDLHNNDVGRDLAAPGATRAQLQQAVVDALRSGRLVIIDAATGRPVPSGSCVVTL